MRPRSTAGVGTSGAKSGAMIAATTTMITTEPVTKI
jgi:hypothetical protein